MWSLDWQTGDLLSSSCLGGLQIILASFCRIFLVKARTIFFDRALGTGASSHFLTSTVFLIQVNVSELGLVTPAGKVVWGKLRILVHGGCVSDATP